MAKPNTAASPVGSPPQQLIRARPMQDLPSFSHDELKVRRGLHHRAVQENRLRQRVAPACCRRVSGRQIPEEPFAIATVRVNIAGDFGFLDSCRENMAGVPELSDAAIIETIQHTRARRTPIGREDRFPNREHNNRAFGVLLQNRLDCGGPPQTSRSSRREQQYHAQVGRRPIEFRLQGGKSRAVNFH